MKAFGYLRVSGRGQVDGDGFPRQRLAVEEYARANGIEIVEWFEERGVGGSTEWGERPAWSAMLDRILNNGVRAIAIERLDRLARDLMVQEHIIADLHKREVALVSVYEPDLGSKDPTRVMMRQIMGAIAQYDKAMIVRKLRGSRERAKARDGRCEGRKPYGMKPGEESTLAAMLEWKKLGWGPSAIAVELNKQERFGREGGKWHPHTVARIIGRAK